MALWGGRFTHDPDENFKKLNNSLRVDYRMLEQDIMGSIGWSKALTSVGILTTKEQSAIETALLSIHNEAKDNLDVIQGQDFEDVHSWVESKLIEQVGDLGKKLHTGRSRNDQATLDLRLWCRIQVISLQQSIYYLQQKLLITAEKFHAVIMPGYTHLQRAQPITFAHWCLAYFEMLERDYSRLTDAAKRLNVSPLGSAALSGTAYKIDRELLAQDLGFSSASTNSLDAVSDRDYVLELLSSASISMVHLSRFAEDLIIYNSSEFNFIELSDLVTSGSSLMPQKKNPDSCELIRGKSARVVGDLISMLMVMKGLPLSYNKDMQEDKALLFDGLDTWQLCLTVSQLVLKDINVKQDNIQHAIKSGYLNATELADYLVMKQIPFRQAHHMVGEIVLYAIAENKALEDLQLKEFNKFSPLIEDDVYTILSLESCLAKRDTKGGVAPQQTAKAIADVKQILANRKIELEL